MNMKIQDVVFHLRNLMHRKWQILSGSRIVWSMNKRPAWKKLIYRVIYRTFSRQCFGTVDEKFLPDWAKESLSQFQQEEAAESPGMNNQSM